MIEKKITCIVCPIGCEIFVKGKGEQIQEMDGYQCNRGMDYAKTEFIAPMRIFTSTVKIKYGCNPIIPVRSNQLIPKNKILECMKVIKSVEVKAPIQEGEIVVANILDTGANIITTTGYDCAF
ncbi:MAG: hypothetical protein PWP27_1675 [Clostridiales bacterium]|jgi:CxxC motif-containing protein|nr:hypothetical protein [Clostridiales bacterium]MDK2933865.1 hypothetical protein [Clostridiales bacterium]